MAGANGNSGRFSGGAWDEMEKRFYRVKLPTSEEELNRLLYGRKPVVPVLFIPGIMGSVLKTSGIKHKMAWDPPSNVIQDVSTLVKYLFMSAEERAEVLDPNKTQVFRANAGPVTADAKTGSVAQASRGWESVWKAGYWSMLEDIEAKLNSQSMPEGLDDPPFEYGIMGNGAPLTKEDFNKVLRRYRYEVWGGGYNWLQGNADSADKLWDYVENTILKAYPRDILNEEEKILIVTHSMGGFVARSLCAEKSRRERILGVVHTVMPALGAPATYKRMRAGFEGISSPVLGYNAAEVTSVLAAAQGGLELLPFAGYMNGGPWLTCPEEIKDSQSTVSFLPSMGDPYKTIYKSKEWYGIVPDYHEYMLPSGNDELSTRDQFNNLINRVQTFHETITDVYHPQTYAIWASFAKMKAWGRVAWEHRPIPFYKFFTSRSEEHKDTQLGRVYQGDHMADIEPPDCYGDGTVPMYSAKDQMRVGTGKYFIHRRENMRSGNRDYEHSMCFEHKMMRWSVVYSVARIVLKTLGKG